VSADVDQDKLLALCADEVASGRLPACQLALALDGEVVLRATFGATEDARFTVFSVTKALLAATVWLFLPEALRPETRVAELVPELAREGFDEVTVEHLLTHTAGFPRAPMGLEEGATSEGRRARAPSTTPPRRTGSSPRSSSRWPARTTARWSATG